MRTYEATILVSSTKARADYDAAIADAKAVFETEGAEFSEFEKWEERKLAYPIKGETSAVYINAYFTAPADAIDKIERRVQLGDAVLRHLVIAREEQDLAKMKDQRAKQAELAARREAEKE